MISQINETLKIAVENGDVSGANVLVLHNGREVYCQYGMRDIENSLPVERDTIFRLYSQTKPITAAAVVLLASEGKIDMGAWLSDYMPEFACSYVNADG